MVIVNGDTMTIGEVVRVARFHEEVTLSKEVYEQIEQSRAMVERFIEKKVVSYGITTGFGKFSDVLIQPENATVLQRKLIMSHACGIGEPFPEEVVRGIMLLRVNSLCKGYSGIRLCVIQTLIDMLNRDVTPWVPEKGSLGASGDLCPLAHIALVAIYEGKAYYKGQLIGGAEAMQSAGIPKVTLEAKEGLALINGTQVMTSIACLALHDFQNCLKAADIALSLSMEALGGLVDAFDPRVHKVRPHPGQVHTAENVLALVRGSRNVVPQGRTRVQDAYVLRCAPQVHGASRNACDHVAEIVGIEINSVTDNPVLFSKDDYAISGGNFHGQPIALPMDYLGIAIAEIADISERRIERLLNPNLNYGLPAFLSVHGGLNSGLMIVQYAAASLVSENKVLAHPASVDSIPSSANQEDHVSMGTIAARKAAQILDHAQKVVGMELFAAAQAIDLRGAQKQLGTGSKAAYERIRRDIHTIEEDEIMYPLLEKADQLVKSGELVKAVEKCVPLHG